MFRILLIDDDVEFRDSLKKGLENDGHTIITADHGGQALQMLTQATFDVILTDMKMPEMDGLEFIKSVRAQDAGLPIVLMTGFSELIEAKEAYALGANEFLPKPFHRSELNGLLKRLVGRKFATTADHHSYCRMGLDEFVSGRRVKFAIYLRVGNDRYIKVAHKGEDITADRLKAYRKKGLDYLFLRQDDFRQYVGFDLDPDHRIVSAADRAKKFHLMRHSASVLADGIRHEGLDPQLYVAAAAFVESTLDLITDDRRAMEMLDRLRAHADQVLAHSLGVGVFGVLIGQRIQWHLPNNRFKLALGGILHDVGQQEISQHILATPANARSDEDRAAFETHCAIGHEMLQEIRAIPDDVRLVVQQHHENRQGHGYPAHLAPDDIHPMAKVIAVADEFCYRTLDPGSSTPEIALKDMAQQAADLYEREYLQALNDLFNAS